MTFLETAMRIRVFSRFAILLQMLGLLALMPVSAAQRAAAPPAASSGQSLLRIAGIDVQPANPGPDTLCRLQIRLLNSGKDAASDLSFQVTVNGQRLANFINHTWRTVVPPGKETAVQVHNFWSSEAGRAYPSDGRLVVEVRLMGARWVDPRSSNAAALAGAVQPLPGPLSVTLTRAEKR